MRTKLLLLTLSCLLLFAVTGQAQVRIVTTPDGVKQLIEYEKEYENSILFGAKILKSSMNMFWDNGFFGVLAPGWGEDITWLEAPELLSALGISDEQLKEILEKRSNHNSPDIREMEVARVALVIMVRALLEPDVLRGIVLSSVAENAQTIEQRQKQIYTATMEKLPIVLPEWGEPYAHSVLTDAQRQDGERLKKKFEPEFEKHLEYLIKNVVVIKEPYGLYDIDVEVINKLFECRHKEGQALYSSVLSRVAEDVLTSEQKQKINEIYTVSMGKVPMISSRAFEALDLTDTQRLEVERIKKELGPEFEKYIKDYVKNIVTLIERLDSKIAHQIKDKEESTVGIEKRLLAEDAEIRKINYEILSMSQAFANQFKTQVFNVLTDEQRRRFQELNDNPPEHVQIFLKVMSCVPVQEFCVPPATEKTD